MPSFKWAAQPEKQLADHAERCALGYRIAADELDFLDHAVARSNQSVFHFHGFKHNNGFALGHRITYALVVLDDQAWHRCNQTCAMRIGNRSRRSSGR